MSDSIKNEPLQTTGIEDEKIHAVALAAAEINRLSSANPKFWRQTTTVQDKSAQVKDLEEKYNELIKLMLPAKQNPKFNMAVQNLKEAFALDNKSKPILTLEVMDSIDENLGVAISENNDVNEAIIISDDLADPILKDTHVLNSNLMEHKDIAGKTSQESPVGKEQPTGQLNPGAPTIQPVSTTAGLEDVADKTSQESPVGKEQATNKPAVPNTSGKESNDSALEFPPKNPFQNPLNNTGSDSQQDPSLEMQRLAKRLEMLELENERLRKSTSGPDVVNSIEPINSTLGNNTMNAGSEDQDNSDKDEQTTPGILQDFYAQDAVLQSSTTFGKGKLRAITTVGPRNSPNYYLEEGHPFIFGSNDKASRLDQSIQNMFPKEDIRDVILSKRCTKVELLGVALRNTQGIDPQTASELISPELKKRQPSARFPWTRVYVRWHILVDSKPSQVVFWETRTFMKTIWGSHTQQIIYLKYKSQVDRYVAWNEGKRPGTSKSPSPVPELEAFNLSKVRYDQSPEPDTSEEDGSPRNFTRRSPAGRPGPSSRNTPAQTDNKTFKDDFQRYWNQYLIILEKEEQDLESEERYQLKAMALKAFTS